MADTDNAAVIIQNNNSYSLTLNQSNKLQNRIYCPKEKRTDMLLNTIEIFGYCICNFYINVNIITNAMQERTIIFSLSYI